MTHQDNSKTLQNTLAKRDLHEQWWVDYLDDENNRFFETTFDELVKRLNPSQDAVILDAGCGDASHAMSLASRGFRVKGIDFSETVLEQAQQRVEEFGFSEQIQLEHGNLLDLQFDDATFEYVFCWGVMMHIPDVETALRELARVIKPGGVLVIGENNNASFQSFFRRNVRRLVGTKTFDVKDTPAGTEYWKETSAGRFMAREANQEWYIKTLEGLGFAVEHHLPGQFSEMYTKVPSAALKKMVHQFNMFWFKQVGNPGAAFGNILIFRKL